jgi:hypothetical protein
MSAPPEASGPCEGSGPPEGFGSSEGSGASAETDSSAEWGPLEPTRFLEDPATRDDAFTRDLRAFAARRTWTPDAVEGLARLRARLAAEPLGAGAGADAAASGVGAKAPATTAPLGTLVAGGAAIVAVVAVAGWAAWRAFSPDVDAHPPTSVVDGTRGAAPVASETGHVARVAPSEGPTGAEAPRAEALGTEGPHAQEPGSSAPPPGVHATEPRPAQPWTSPPLSDARAPSTVHPASEGGPAGSAPLPARPQVDAPRSGRPSPGLEASELQREAEAVAAARAALDHEPARTLSLLDAIERDVGRGYLGEERLALRALALLATGRRSSGERVARRYLAAHPDGSFAARIRHALGVAAPGP